MGDCFQAIVVREVSEDNAVYLGEIILKYLVEKGIVSTDITECVLSSDGIGYPPGPNYEKALKEPDTQHDLLSLITNGLDVITKREVFHSGQGGFNLVCPSCKERFEPNENWGDAVSEWYEDLGAGELSCPKCQYMTSIINWKHDPPYGFSCLGFEFWNWPILSDEFIEEIAELSGHEIVFVAGKL